MNVIGWMIIYIICGLCLKYFLEARYGNYYGTTQGLEQII